MQFPERSMEYNTLVTLSSLLIAKVKRDTWLGLVSLSLIYLNNNEMSGSFHHCS